MATMWRKAMLYLGLGPDDEYEEDVTYVEPAPTQRATAPASATAGAGAASTSSRAQGASGAPPRQRPAARPSPADAVQGTPVRPNPPAPPRQEAPPVPTPPSTSKANRQPAPKPNAAVRQVPAGAKPHLVAPTSFNDAQVVADRIRANQPVILNLQGVDRDLARRLIDFSSGLCYGLTGHMEKVASHVYLLTPSNVEVSVEERRRLQERGLHDG